MRRKSSRALDKPLITQLFNVASSDPHFYLASLQSICKVYAKKYSNKKSYFNIHSLDKRNFGVCIVPFFECNNSAICTHSLALKLAYRD